MRKMTWLLLVMLLALVVGSAAAQEATPEPAPTATPTPLPPVEFSAPALEFAEGKCRAWVREDVERWAKRREEHA